MFVVRFAPFDERQCVLLCIVSCDALSSVSPHQATLDLSNLNHSVFTDCPDALNADNYDASKLQLIVEQAYQVCSLLTAF